MHDSNNIPLGRNSIKYESFKLHGKELVEAKNYPLNQYNTLNLDEASIIPEKYEILNSEFEKLQKKYE